MKPITARIIVAVLLLTVGASVSWWLCGWRFSSSRRSGDHPFDKDALVAQARMAFAEGRWDDVEQLARKVLDRHPSANEALLLAAEASLRKRQLDRAVEYLDRLELTSGDGRVEALARAGDLLWQAGHVRKTERLLRRVLVHDPGHIVALRRLAFLLAVEGRRWESAPLLFELLKRDQILVDELVLLGDLWPDYSLVSETMRYLKAVPHDPLPRLAMARDAAHRYQLDEARRWLEQILAVDPDLVEAHAWLGWTLVQADDAEALEQWEKRLPAPAAEHPLIWYVRGLAAQNFGQPRQAVRCFWEAVRRDPNFDQANYQLSVGLAALGQLEQAEPFRQRAERLFALNAALKDIYNHRQELDRLSDLDERLGPVIEMCESLGRIWEARQWCRLLLSLRPATRWAHEAQARYERQLQPSTPLTLESANPTSAVDLSHYPLPEGLRLASRSASDPVGLPRTASVHFVDRAAGAGLQFVAYNGDDASTPDMRLLENTGCGAGVIDFDADGWPDIYLAQACPWPVDPEQTRYEDRLFRNVSGTRFRDVTEQADLGDTRFSQGVAIGDYDNDGFSDIFLANIGGNRLYRNNGDGTFTEVTDLSLPPDERWTASCAIADVNGDSLPDLYEVNYLAGDAL